MFGEPLSDLRLDDPLAVADEEAFALMAELLGPPLEPEPAFEAAMVW